MGKILEISNRFLIKFIIRLSLATNIEDFSNIEIDVNLASKIATDCDMREILTIFMERNTVYNTWIELKRERIGKREEIRIKTDHYLRKILSEYFEEEKDRYWNYMQPLVYLEQFYSTVILKNINSNVYFEDIIENTEVNSSSVWSAYLRKPPQNYCYFIEDEVSFSEVKDLVRFHDVSMKSFLSEEEGTFSFKKSLETMTKFMGDREFTYLSVLENLLMKLLTVCKIYMQYDEGLEYTLYIRKLYETKSFREKFKKLEMMVELYEADILYRIMKKPGRNGILNEEKNLFTQIDVIDRLTQTFQHEESYIFTSEFLITKYFILGSLYKKYKKDKEKTELYSIIEYMRQLRDGMDFDNDVYLFIWAKLNYVIAYYRYLHTEMEINDLQYLKKSAKVFERYNSLRLLSKCLYLLGLLHTNNAESCLKYCKTALEFAEIVGEERLIKDLKYLVNQSNKRLRYKYQNKFMFLTSNPMNSKHYQAKHCGLKLNKNLRNYLMETLKESGKNILAHFDILTKKIMYELFTKNQGCKLLVIDNFYDNKKGIVGEGEDFKEEIFSFEMLDKMSKDDTQVKINIDVLILLSDDPIKLAKFSKSKGIPVVIYFNFKENPSSFTEIITTFLQKEMKYLFLKNFVRYCLRNFKIEDALQNAKSDTVEELSDNLSRNYEYLEVDMNLLNSSHSNSSRRNPKELQFPSIEKIIEDSLIIYKDQNIDVKFELREGRMEDTSTVGSVQLSLFNFKDPYIVRHKEIVGLYNKVKKFNWVNLHSEKGLGKTHFLKQFRNELLLRNCYPDGVFIFDMKEVKKYSSNRNLKDLIKVEFGQRFDQNMDEFFEGKKMLIILDDFGLICNHKEIRYPTYFLRALEKHKITTIFITHKEMIKTEIIQNLDHYKLSGFDWKKTLVMYLSLQRNLFIKLKNFNEKYLKSDPCFKKSHGSPKLIRSFRYYFLVKCLKIEGAYIGNNSELLNGIMEPNENAEFNINSHLFEEDRVQLVQPVLGNILSDDNSNLNVIKPIPLVNETENTDDTTFEKIKTDIDFSIESGAKFNYLNSYGKEVYNSEYEEEPIIDETTAIEPDIHVEKHQLQTEIFGNIDHPFLRPIHLEQNEDMEEYNQLGNYDNEEEICYLDQTEVTPEIVKQYKGFESKKTLRLSETGTVNSYNQNPQSVNNLSDLRGNIETPDPTPYLAYSNTLMTDMGYDAESNEEEDRHSAEERMSATIKKRNKGGRKQRYKKALKRKKKIKNLRQKEKEKDRKKKVVE